MAGIDGAERQRPALPPISHLDLDKIKADRQEPRFPPINAVNTSGAPMGSPNTVYAGPPPPYSYVPNTNGSIHAGYISPPESTTRRSTREEEKPSPRKSLPSIHEALGESKALPPFSATSQHPSLSTPSTAMSQHFPDAPKGPSNPFSAPSFRENPFVSHPGCAPAPPDLPAKEPSSIHPAQSPRSSLLPSFHSGPTVSASSTFANRAEPPQQPRSPGTDPSRPNFPSFSRPPPSSYRDEPFQFSGSSSAHESRPSFNRIPEPAYDSTIKRHIDVHEAARDLTEIREINARNADLSHNWTQRYQQGNRSGFFQDSFPEIREIDDMMRHSQMMLESLARIRDVVIQQQSALEDHRARFNRGTLDEEYHARTESYDPNFSGGDSKKRRGKAAPPGRCHSCNRAETPEWRRGPDGARTLCNACGLHYAKLTRKIGASKASQIRGADIRPKNLDLHP